MFYKPKLSIANAFRISRLKWGNVVDVRLRCVNISTDEMINDSREAKKRRRNKIKKKWKPTTIKRQKTGEIANAHRQYHRILKEANEEET